MVKTRIKKLRQERHLSQEQLAAQAQVSVRTIQRLEAGEDASISTLNLVAKALQVEVGDLFEHKEAQEQQAKIASAKEQLEYQQERRQSEFQNFKNIYDAIFIVIMLITVVVVPQIDDNDNLWLVWACAWMFMSPLQKLLALHLVDPKLDKKYPLTAMQTEKQDK
ncbi:MAG: helix-turn-helix domain-containing protein [Lactobacillus sp.]|jgi:transcriptional regulator with XRE-family HTH domain|nr:helix-turn-helix domain-containing protein [Lactobacillus sp.]MCH4068168.1 helix-turn-helix domain-containing protein [Lactobacillus sp.]MCI1304349.1 helix-turn-helix domain-containing protein [Lactobacillus sp.]MCI1330099.1 helix-turn-helix domain-containing protein [Lactobacillus sp.]MCI1360016.1 helix-turn-helix domain-containing protein [Lactobacillus sp.]